MPPGRRHGRVSALMSDGDSPTHPTRQAILLLVGVTLLIVALAVISSWDAL